MIKNKSPYYIDTPFVSPSTALTCSQYTLKVYVWNGLKTTVPSTATYEITKQNPTTSTLTDSINIARIIKDFLTFVPQEGTVTALIDGVNQMWVRTEAYYTTTTASELLIPQNVATELMVGGYAYGRDGKNQSVQANKILLDGTEFNVNRGGFFVLPIETAETPETPSVIVIDTVTYNTTAATTSNIDLAYTITGFSPTNVTIETSPPNFNNWFDQESRANSSPLTSIDITYPSSSSKDVRLTFYDGVDFYVSNTVNIGLE
jgi:hypothetical protein